ncbi:hypothetical protein [Nitrosomonas ureae]|uniref:Uncharacterized protein n=1 Tax=Nitrosomonas ureae TaxID=44577 RepID=A0A2T5I622_9PROT|nr:hypothetical protein [Nitrosomonas ureae]PTQ79273.1 hypothetical protein C8R28_10535 [Nitrosomonas ureae]
MDTEQQKAEDFVRHHKDMGHLLNLTWGCEVMVQGNKGVVVNNDFIQLDTDELITIAGAIEIIQVIGHPIKFSDWLSVLGEVETNLTVVLYSQKILIGNSLGFDLITGQPETEADYQAFNQMVGNE